MTERGMDLSVVIPLYNEQANIPILYSRLKAVLDRIGLAYEILLVDDGSSDGTFSVLRSLMEVDETIKIIKLKGNFGQTAALVAGFDQAMGKIIIAMDGDLQHEPEDIPKFLEKLAEGYDIVSGYRQKRVDSFLFRCLPSRIANRLMAWLSGVKIQDFGTTFKAYRSEVIRGISLYGEFHRFIPALAHELRASIAEVPITNAYRFQGKSNYTLRRTQTVLFDLIRIKFLSAYLARPLQAFGLPGLFLGGMGFLLASYLGWEKFALHYHIMVEHGPLLLLSILLIILGAQFFALGLLSEILVKAYYETGQKKIYSLEGVWKRDPSSPVHPSSGANGSHAAPGVPDIARRSDSA